MTIHKKIAVPLNLFFISVTLLTSSAQHDHQAVAHQHFFNLRYNVETKTRTMYTKKLVYFAQRQLIAHPDIYGLQLGFENLLFNDAQTSYVQMLNNFKQNQGFNIDEYFEHHANPRLPLAIVAAE